MLVGIGYSKWSCAFLDLQSSEGVCARKSTCKITPFSVGCFSGGTCRSYKIKTSIYGFNLLLWSIIAVELTNSSTTQNHVVFQSTSEQANHGMFDILKKFSLQTAKLWKEHSIGTEDMLVGIGYSKWSCAFLDLQSSEGVCARKSTCKNHLIWLQFSFNYAIFCWMFFRRYV